MTPCDQPGGRDQPSGRTTCCSANSLSSCVGSVADAGCATTRNGNGLGREDADDAGVAVDLGDAATHDVRQADFGAVALTLARCTPQLPHDLSDLHRT